MRSVLDRPLPAIKKRVTERLEALVGRSARHDGTENFSLLNGDRCRVSTLVAFTRVSVLSETSASGNQKGPGLFQIVNIWQVKLMR